ncbi:hypothetical protein [Desulfovirgula thermocuniculi]|uniref:hypothetical protein n=1 Tax=Desulfovirgula thermocuniculi TaxID=348842 RepID=UPI0004859AFE|nr:hypothetical protein [Desulfovirgula thermocuniculi]
MEKPKLELLKIAKVTQHHFALPYSYLRDVLGKDGRTHLAVYRFGKALVLVPANIEVDGEALEGVRKLLGEKAGSRDETDPPC